MVVCSSLLAVSAYAQESTSKQINQIKRDTCYLYAEATMEDADEALSVARELLIQQVQEYIDGQPKFSKAGNVLVKDVGADSQLLSMMRGPMHRMFVYVKKSNIEMVGNAITIKNVAEVRKVDEIASPVTVGQPQVEPQPQTAVATTPSKEENENKKENVKENVKENEKASLSDMSQWQLDAITSLMGSGGINQVLARLKRLKSEYKIKKYGAPQQCPSASEAFWIVFDANGSVIDILGPGESRRVGFKEKVYTTLEQYKGMDAIWFNFVK